MNVNSIGSLGGKARALKLSPARRSEISKAAANKRWSKKNHPLHIMDNKTKHVVITEGQGKCLHCGDCHPFEMPMLINDFVEESRQFIERHSLCKPKSPQKDLPEKV